MEPLLSTSTMKEGENNPSNTSRVATSLERTRPHCPPQIELSILNAPSPRTPLAPLNFDSISKCLPLNLHSIPGAHHEPALPVMIPTSILLNYANMYPSKTFNETSIIAEDEAQDFRQPLPQHLSRRSRALPQQAQDDRP